VETLNNVLKIYTNRKIRRIIPYSTIDIKSKSIAKCITCLNFSFSTLQRLQPKTIHYYLFSVLCSLHFKVFNFICKQRSILFTAPDFALNPDQHCRITQLFALNPRLLLSHWNNIEQIWGAFDTKMKFLATDKYLIQSGGCNQNPLNLTWRRSQENREQVLLASVRSLKFWLTFHPFCKPTFLINFRPAAVTHHQHLLSCEVRCNSASVKLWRRASTLLVRISRSVNWNARKLNKTSPTIRHFLFVRLLEIRSIAPLAKTLNNVKWDHRP